MLTPFVNEPPTDFSDPDVSAAFQAAVERLRADGDRHWPLVIGGVGIDTETTITSINPAKPSEVLGTTASADAAMADRALDAAWEAFPAWAATPAAERAELVVAIAQVMRDRKYDFLAMLALEASKNGPEADGDFAEALDFCEYYARSAIEAAQPVLDDGRNVTRLIPLGAGVVIPPWNFPVAIAVGMTIGPVAAGNTVVLKPASNTPLLSAMFVQAAHDAGLPPGVINHLPGPGGAVGEALVTSPKTRFVNFTGSRDVGVGISEEAGKVRPGQKWIKRAYMEMGGKDALIVDETADLDAAAAAAVGSAFGYQGQKCSALSRLIVLDEVHDTVVDRVIEKSKALTIGPPDQGSDVCAVISEAQYNDILREIESGKQEAKLVYGGEPLDGEGYYIQPTIFTEVQPDHRLAQHEIFGPVLSVIRARDFDHAIEIANGTDYGLTGGLFSTDPERIERAEAEFFVGNLYLNDKITGALVGQQPFGGFNMSGTNSKAGGPDYVKLFMQAKTVADRGS